MFRPTAFSTLRRGFATQLLPTSKSPISPSLSFFNSVTGNDTQIPTYRVLDGMGKPIEGAEIPEITRDFARKMYEKMCLLPQMDTILYNSQRQGKISFYMTSHGEEAAIVGSAAGLDFEDEALAQYREAGLLLWRDYPLDSIMAQCFGSYEDSAKGRQMPVHYGSKEYHFHTISSPLATQIPQAAGVAFALRRTPERRDKSIAACYFGEGAASEGDFHAGMLLASTIPSPVLFIARNNGFAISTPAAEQYHGDGIASRGPGYGVDTIRVDGNDALAVLAATREARKRCLKGGRAVLMEVMTYRVGHHSTSDDSFAYRARSEVEDRKRVDNPIARFRLFLESQGWWNGEEEEELKTRLKAEVMKAFKKAESAPRPPLGEMFTDIYAGEMPWNLKEQREELKQLLNKYKDYDGYKKELAKFTKKGEDVMQ